MSESRNDGRNAGAGQPQNLSVLAQYVKDLSFENPGAPQSLRGRNTQPTINISLNVHASPVYPRAVRSAERRLNGKPVDVKPCPAAALTRRLQITEPCPVPFSSIVTAPSSRTPARSHFWTSRRRRLSPIRCSRKRTTHSWETSVKNDRMSAWLQER